MLSDHGAGARARWNYLMVTCRLFSVAEVERYLVDNLHRIREMPWDVIVHIPRSGTIPASILSTYIPRPLCSVDEYCSGVVSDRKSERAASERVLIVDDLARTGGQMRSSIERILQARPNTEIKTLAVYRVKNLRGKELLHRPDMVLRTIRDRFYTGPWFLWKNSRVIPRMAVDFDGVLCRDCVKTEDYDAFLASAEPKFRPLVGEIRWIVTGRREKYRGVTERWLKRNGVRYTELLMFPDDLAKSERARWKAETYRMLRDAVLFVESSEREAQIIASVSGKSVWCVDSSRGYNGD